MDQLAKLQVNKCCGLILWFLTHPATRAVTEPSHNFLFRHNRASRRDHVNKTSTVNRTTDSKAHNGSCYVDDVTLPAVQLQHDTVFLKNRNWKTVRENHWILADNDLRPINWNNWSCLNCLLLSSLPGQWRLDGGHPKLETLSHFCLFISVHA